MRRLSGQLAFVCLLSVGVLAQSGPTAEARALWDRMATARGGRAALSGIKSFVISLDQPGTHLTVIADLPDRIWTWDDYRPGKLGFGVTVRNGAKQVTWVADRGQPARAVQRPWGGSDDEGLVSIIRMNSLAYFSETAFFHPEPVIVHDVKGDVATLEAIAPGYASLSYMVDLRSGLPLHLTARPAIGLEHAPASFTDEYSYESWTTVSGIVLPKRMREGGAAIDVTIEVNMQIDSALFETPPDNVTSRDWWRRFLRGR